MTGENEFDFSISRIHVFWNEIVENPLNIIDLSFSFIGHYGVQIFILLSGYGLMLAYGKAEIKWRFFMAKRLNKLYPTYIFALIFFAIFEIIWHSNSFPVVDYLLKLSFATNFIPGEIFSLNGPWWFYGMIVELYMVFPLLLKIYNKFSIVGLITTAAISYAVMLIWGNLLLKIDNSFYFHFIGNLPVFIFGILLASQGEIKIKKYWVLIAIAIFIFGNLNQNAFYFSHLSIAFLLLIISLKLQKLFINQRIISHLIVFIGEISMYIFAIHGFLRQPFIELADKVTNPAIRPFSTIAMAILFVAFSIMIALILRWLVQKYIFSINYKLNFEKFKVANRFWLKFLHFSNRFIIISILLLFCLFIIKFIEYFYIVANHPLIEYSLKSATISAFRDIPLEGSYLAMIFPLLVIFAVIKPKIATNIYLAFIISVLVSYIALIQYFNMTLVSLDEIIFTFTFSGILELIKTIISFQAISIISYSLIIFLFFLAIYKSNNISLPQGKILLFLIIFAILIPFHRTFYTIANEHNTIEAYNCNNLKVVFFTKSISNYLNDGKEINNSEKIKNEIALFQKLYPEKKYVGNEYPFLQFNNMKSTLAPFFKQIEDAQKPNIVYIIVDGLFNSNINTYINNYSISPFLDSLKKASLYWKNGLKISKTSDDLLPDILGSMPSNNSDENNPDYLDIISYLKRNNYKTSYSTYGNKASKQSKNYLLKSGIDNFSEENPQKSLDGNLRTELNFSIFNFAKSTIGDKSEQAIYESIADFYLKRNTKEISKLNFQKYKTELAEIRYLDEQLKRFFRELQKREDFKRTIFIITGSSSNYDKETKNILEKHKVPIIIYSQLLKKSQEFTSIASQVDILPSITSLLEANYKFNPQYFNHNIGYQLDTTNNIQNNHNYVLLGNHHQTNDLIFGKYYLSGTDLFEINENLKIKRISNKLVSQHLKKYIHDYNIISSYSICKNKLVPKSYYYSQIGRQTLVNFQSGFEEVDSTYYSNQLVENISYYGHKSLSSNNLEFSLLYPEFNFKSSFSNIKIEIEFNIYLKNSTSNNPLIIITGNNNQLKSLFWEGIDFLKENKVVAGKWFKIKTEKSIKFQGEFDINSILKMYFWNRSKSTYYIDNLKIRMTGIPYY